MNTQVQNRPRQTDEDRAVTAQRASGVERGAAGFMDVLAGRREDIVALLPATTSFDAFVRVCRTAVLKTPELLEGNKAALLQACLNAAADGLLPDGKEGAIVARYDRNLKTKAATWQPMVWGLAKRAYQTGLVLDISTTVVKEGEFFDWEEGTERFIKHKPSRDCWDKSVVAAYAIVRTKDGGMFFDVMWEQELMKAKAVGSATNGPWASWADEMRKKTVLRRLFKKLPSSSTPEWARFQTAMERVDEISEDEDDEQPQAQPANPADRFRAQAAQQAIAHDQTPPVTIPAGVELAPDKVPVQQGEDPPAKSLLQYAKDAGTVGQQAAPEAAQPNDRPEGDAWLNEPVPLLLDNQGEPAFSKFLPLVAQALEWCESSAEVDALLATNKTGLYAVRQANAKVSQRWDARVASRRAAIEEADRVAAASA